MNERDLPKRHLLVRFSAVFFRGDGVIAATERFDATTMRGAKLIAHRRMKAHGAASARIRNRENNETARIEAKQPQTVVR